MSNDGPLEALRRVLAALRPTGIHPVLIGGVAIHLTVTRQGEDIDVVDDPRAAPLDDPRRLACLVRPTRDVDLVIPAEAIEPTASRLEAVGFRRNHRVRPPPVRLDGDEAAIDLIARAATVPDTWPVRIPELGETLAWLETRATLATADAAGEVRLASPAALALLKAVAWAERRERRDLADLARLAVWDRAAGSAAAELAGWAVDLPAPIRDALTRAAKAFSEPHGLGASSFVRELAPELPGLRYDEELEDEVRGLVALAGRVLLAPFAERPRGGCGGVGRGGGE